MCVDSCSKILQALLCNLHDAVLRLYGVQIKMSDEDMTVVCTIIATAEYCSEVVGSLGRSIAKTLEPPYNEQVSDRHSPQIHHALLFAVV